MARTAAPSNATHEFLSAGQSTALMEATMKPASAWGMSFFTGFSAVIVIAVFVYAITQQG